MKGAAEFDAMMFGSFVFASGAIEGMNQLELDRMPRRSLQVAFKKLFDGHAASTILPASLTVSGAGGAEE